MRNASLWWASVPGREAASWWMRFSEPSVHRPRTWGRGLVYASGEAGNSVVWEYCR